MQQTIPYRTQVCLTILAICVLVGTSVAQRKEEGRFASRVSEDRLLSQVRELVRRGSRTGGTPSGDSAAAFVLQQFKRAGYEPIVEVDSPSLVTDSKRWMLRVDRPSKLRRLIQNEWIGAYSPTVPLSQAQLVYLANPGASTKTDVSHRAVLIDQMLPRRLYHRFEQDSVRCLLLISPAIKGVYTDWASISDLSPSKRNQIPLFNISYNNGQALKKSLVDSQRVMVSFSAQTKIDSARPKTVIATLRGKSKKYFLVCAHGDSDSGGPGADDNASGVSAVLETARVLNGLVRTGHRPQPKVSIRFAVWGAEIHSTDDYIRAHREELGNILGVLNLDEVGTGASRDCLYFESNDVPYNEPLLRTLERVGEDYVGKKGYWSESTTNPSQGGTDSYMFFPDNLRRLDVPETEIPSVTIYTAAWNELKALPQTPGWNSRAWHGPKDTVYIDYSRYYHSSLDTPERTTEKEPFNMVGAAKALGIALLRLAW